MGIDKEKGFFTLTCDNCGEELNRRFEDFYDAVEAKKENGWKSKKVNCNWEDWCPKCCEG